MYFSLMWKGETSRREVARRGVGGGKTKFSLWPFSLYINDAIQAKAEWWGIIEAQRISTLDEGWNIYLTTEYKTKNLFRQNVFLFFGM